MNQLAYVGRELELDRSAELLNLVVRGDHLAPPVRFRPGRPMRRQLDLHNCARCDACKRVSV